jgi:N-acetylglucosamine malate deacetylase 1
MMTSMRAARKLDASEYLMLIRSYPWLSKTLIQEPEVNSNSRVLVLAPHHFDEIIGCGGTMCKLAKRGAHVKVIYLTNSSYDGTGPERNLVPLVRTEAEETLKKLLCFESEILDLPCLNMHCDKESINKLYRKIEYYSPDLIFIPTLHEKHPDNVMTGRLAVHALKGYTGCLTLYSYEVWGGLFPNLVVDITNVMDEKINAMQSLRSETELKDEEQRLRESNIFRLTTMQAERYCEPFLRQEREEFVNLAKSRRPARNERGAGRSALNRNLLHKMVS